MVLGRRYDVAKRAAKRRGKKVPRNTWTEQDARRVLEECEKSGESVAGFARRLGVIPQRLFWWRKRLGHASSLEAPPTFVPVTVRPAMAESIAVGVPVVVTVGNGIRVEIHDVDAHTAAWVAALVGHLGEPKS
jgi:transposase-like protein